MMVTVVKEEADFKPYFDMKKEKPAAVESGDFASEVKSKNENVQHIFSELYGVKEDIKPILEDGKIAEIEVKEEPKAIFMFPHEGVKPMLKQESVDTNNVVKKEPVFDPFSHLCSDWKPVVASVVKQEVINEACKEEIRETGGKADDGKKMSAELIFGEDNVPQTGKIQLKISNVRSLNDATDIPHTSSTFELAPDPGRKSQILKENVTMRIAEDERMDVNLDEETESSSNQSCPTDVLSPHLCPSVISQPATHGNPIREKPGERKVDMLERPFKCDVCGARFLQSSHLKQHRRKHTGEKPFKCNVCDAGFANSGNLQRHKRTHTGEKPFKCEFCGDEFARNSQLKRHKITHTGEKLFECEDCGDGFAFSSDLKRHRSIHTGEKPYKCEVCDVGFTRNNHLQRHTKIHTGEKPYKCEACGFRFTQRSDLRRHNKNIHTGEKPYKCEVCDASFVRNSYLKQHRRKHIREKHRKP